MEKDYFAQNESWRQGGVYFLLKGERMTSKDLSSSDITRIIKSAGESGVSKLKFGALEIEFGYPAQRLEASGIEYPSTTPEPPNHRPERNEELADFERAQELITDPAAHEENLIRELSEG